MFRSMFARLFSMFLAVILAVMGAISLMFYVTVRDQRINVRMEELKKEAREIAYLASQTHYTMPNRFLMQESNTLRSSGLPGIMLLSSLSITEVTSQSQ